MTAEIRKLPAPAAAKGSPAERAPHPGFTAPQKAALIIAALGPEAAGPIIERIGDKHLKAFAAAYAHLQKVPKQDLVAVASEFVSHLSARDGEIEGGFEGARDLLSHFKGEEPTTKLLDDVDAPGGRTVWQKLESVSDKAIADYLGNQRPQVVAVVLSRLDIEKASLVLGKLDPELARQVLRRLAQPMPARKEALRVLADAIERDFLNPARAAARAKKPGDMIGAMMNNLPADKRQEMLAFLESETPEILEDVKAQILTFQDLPTRVPPTAISAVIREVEADVFLKAAKYGRQNAPETVDFIFKNISQRMGQQYQEQIDALKQVTLQEAEAAQAEIMSAVRRMVAEGAFALTKVATETAEEELYI